MWIGFPRKTKGRNVADLVIFDLARIQDRSTLPATGDSSRRYRLDLVNAQMMTADESRLSLDCL